MQKYLRGSVRKTSSERMNLGIVEAWRECVDDFLVFKKNKNKKQPIKRSYNKVFSWGLVGYIRKAEKMSNFGKCQFPTL